MDAVYVLGTGSRCNDLELFYSLRSLQEYISGIDRVFIIGTRPRWMYTDYHIPAKDQRACKEANIMEKLLRACEIPDLSEDFFHVHDDHFAMAPRIASELPYWRGGSLFDLASRLRINNHYRGALLNTHHALLERGLTTFNYDLHVPIIYNKKLFPEIMRSYNWDTPRGFVVKSLYANSAGVVSTFRRDLKLEHRHTISEIVALIKGQEWWSTGPSAINNNLKDLLAALYKIPSNYE